MEPKELMTKRRIEKLASEYENNRISIKTDDFNQYSVNSNVIV